MLSRVIAKNVGDVFFETQCIYGALVRCLVSLGANIVRPNSYAQQTPSLWLPYRPTNRTCMYEQLRSTRHPNKVAWC